MATFLNIRTTDAGQALLADVHAGIEELTITHVAFGSGIWEESEHSAMSMTALKNEVMRVAPSGGKQVGGEAELTCVLTNSELDTGFALTEIGIIAQRENGTEVLYMADAVSSARSTWISSKNEYRVEIPVALRIVCSSTSDVEIRVESTSPVTNEDLDNHNIADNAHADIRQELVSHTHSWTNITDKPTEFPVEDHTHTPTEVGLGNLPNAKDDSVTSNRSDVLATSKAVKTAYDKGVAALNTANAKAEASHTHTAFQVGLGNLPNAKSDSVASASNTQLATSKAVKTAYDKGVTALNVANTKAAASHTHTPTEVGLGNIGHKCIINGVSTGAQNQIQDSNLGGTDGLVSKSSRYVLANPFGENTPVLVQAEIYLDGKWANSGNYTNDFTGFFTTASYVQGEGIVLQVGNGGVSTKSYQSGNGHGVTTGLSSARCRVHVWRLGV